METHAAIAGLETRIESRALTNRRVSGLFVATALTLFAVMGLMGLAMRLNQGSVLGINPEWFYRILTLHGAGMLTAALLAVTGTLWYALRDDLELCAKRILVTYALVLSGAVMVVIAVVLGGFATGWTFLWPLPVTSVGQWSGWATGSYLIGLVAVGAGFEIFCIDMLSKAALRYGTLWRALGVDLLRGRDDDPPPPQVVASVVIGVVGLMALVTGTVVITAELNRLVDSSVEINALWAKNLTYFFGHTIANLIIYLAAGTIYALLPRYVGRPWKTTKPLVIAWLFTTVFVVFAYSHHLYMDFVQPRGLEIAASVASYGAAIPVAVVTAYTGLMLVWGSRYRWTLASTLIYLGFAGWLIGGTGAVIDSVIPVNFRLHNTLWVPAHFHTYLLLGVMLWVMAFAAYLLERAAGQVASRSATITSSAFMLVGGYGLVGIWYLSGLLGIPRRYAVMIGNTEGYAVVGAIFVLVFALGFLMLLTEFARLGIVAYRRRAVASPAFYEPDGEPLESPFRPDGAMPVTPPFASGMEVGVAVAAAVVSFFAILPPVAGVAEDNIQWHHFEHAALLLFGALIAMIVASSGARAVKLGLRHAGLGLALVIAIPPIFMLSMMPAIYKSLEDSGLLHLAYHLLLVGFGVLIGWGAARFGREPALTVLVLATGMGVLYALGVSTA